MIAGYNASVVYHGRTYTVTKCDMGMCWLGHHPKHRRTRNQRHNEEMVFSGRRPKAVALMHELANRLLSQYIEGVIRSGSTVSEDWLPWYRS